MRADRGYKGFKRRSLPIRRVQVGERSPRIEDLPGLKKFGQGPVPDWVLIYENARGKQQTQRPQHLQGVLDY